MNKKKYQNSPKVEKAFKKLGGRGRAGNTDYSVKRVSKSSDSTGLKEMEEAFDPTFPSTMSTYSPIPGTANSQVTETMVKIGGKAPKGY